jgi:hypothetical protein
VCAGSILHQIIERAGTLSAGPHHLEQVGQTFDLELMLQERCLGLDSRLDLLLQG